MLHSALKYCCLVSALHAAALAGHSSTVKQLLDHKALINATDLLKHTALFRACEMGHMDVVQTLIDCGAQVDVHDQDGRSPLHWSVERRSPLHLASLNEPFYSHIRDDTSWQL